MRGFVPAGLLAVGLLLGGGVQGQDRARYDSIANRYKGEHAVYTKMHEQLVIDEEDGRLTAQSNVVLEKLLMSDYSLGNYNMDMFWYGDFHVPTSLSGNAYLPAGHNKYKKVVCESWLSGAPYSYMFYDDTRIGAGYYSGLSRNAITETKYTLVHTDMHLLPWFEFQDGYKGLPVAEATLEVVAPDFVVMNFVLKGENTGAIKQTKEEKGGKVYYRFTMRDIPASKRFAHVPSELYYVPHVVPYIVSYRLTGAKKDSVLAKSPDDLYKHQYNYVRGKNIRQDTFLNNTAKRITEGDGTDREKAAHIYKWVQDNIHYVGIENGMEGFVPRAADTVFKRSYGDCKDMSSVIMAMCRAVGVKAYFAWIGTNTLPYSHKDMPIHISNHMICAVRLGDEWVFVDGTHPYLPFGYNRDDIQGKETMIAIDENKYEIVTIPVEPAQKNVVTDSTYLRFEGKKISGSLQQTYKGYQAWELGHWLAMNRDREERRKMVRKLTGRGSDRYELAKYDINANDKGDKDVHVTADFAVDNYVLYAGKECFVNMNVLNNGPERIDMKDRNVGAYFDHTGKHKEVVVMELPKGYKVKYVPKPAKVSLGDTWSYTVSYKADKERITLTKEYELNALAIGVDRLADNNKKVDELNKLNRESVVLTTN